MLSPAGRDVADTGRRGGDVVTASVEDLAFEGVGVRIASPDLYNCGATDLGALEAQIPCFRRLADRLN